MRKLSLLVAVLLSTACAPQEDVGSAQQPLVTFEDGADTLQNAAIGVHRVGPDGIILSVNARELADLGYAEEDYVGHSIVEFHVDADNIAGMLATLTAGSELHNHPARLRKADGSIAYVSIQSNTYRTAPLPAPFVHTRCFTSSITALDYYLLRAEQQ
jgi:PAS domain S-box-containing protein